MNYLIGLAGMWCFTDGWFSLSLYLGRDDQKPLKDHSIRVIRMAVGVGLMIIGGLQ